MKCCILIMGCKVNPGLRNMDAIHDTYITLYNENKNDFENDFDFYFYDGDNEKFYVDKFKEYANIIHCVNKDDIHSTYQKSLEAYNWIIENKKYDWIVRVNISTYVNLYALDKFLNFANKNTIYANQFCVYLYNWHYLNDCYPRGDANIVPFNIFKKAVLKSKTVKPEKIQDRTDKVDDVLMGMAYINSYNDLYINHYQVIDYNFLPFGISEINEKSAVVLNSVTCIFTRLKTCPPNTDSGYSWNDNEYRVQDVEKLKLVNVVIKKYAKKLFINEKNIYNSLISDAETKFLVPYMDLNRNSLNSINFKDLKKIINKKYSNNIIY